MNSDTPAPLPARKWAWVPVAMIAAGFAPLLYWHIVGLLARPHYQFIVLVPIVAWLLSRPRPDETSKTRTSPTRQITIATALLVVSAAGLAYATWIWSPWMAMVSVMPATLALLVFPGGPSLHRWLPVWLFCWILVPPPFGLDEVLIVQLRDVTTAMSSSVLDQIGILHHRYANVIEVPAKSLFIADACSGIHSLYVLMAVALFLSIQNRRSILHTILLLGSTFCLVLVENVARIVTVAAGLERGIDWSVGTEHAILGVVLFAASALLVLSADQLLRLLIPDQPFAWVRGLWRRITKSKKGEALSVAPPNAGGHMGPALSVVVGIAAIFPLLAVGQVLRMPTDLPRAAGFLDSGFDLPEFGTDALPEQMAGFERTEYSTVERVIGDPFGQASQQWGYQNATTTIALSLDYPYSAIHDLCKCYRQVGWKIVEQRKYEPDDISEAFGVNDTEGPIAVVRMERQFYGDKLLIFSLFDIEGRTDVMLKSLNADDSVATRMRNRVAGTTTSAPESQEQKVAAEPPFVQFQMLAKSREPLTEQDTTEAVRIYLESRSILKKRITMNETN